MNNTKTIDNTVSNDTAKSFWQVFKYCVPVYGIIPTLQSAKADRKLSIKDRNHSALFYMGLGLYQGYICSEIYQQIAPHIEKLLH